MANKDGHIYAPVRLKEVARILGEKHLDVGSVCYNPNVNIDSLIRPYPVPDGYVDFPIERMKTYQLGLTHEDDDGVMWEWKQWCYRVPYVGRPQDIETIYLKWWERDFIKRGDRMALNHFDGYQHFANPFLLFHAEGDVGMPISAMISFGAKQDDVMSPNGKGNNGGAVSVMDVFGDAPFYWGIFVTSDRNNRWWYFDPTPIDPNEREFGRTITTDIIPTLSSRYNVIAFVSNLAPEGNQLPNGLRCYGLRMYEECIAWDNVTIPDYSLGLILNVEETNVFGNPQTWRITARSTYQTRMQVAQLTFVYTYYYKNGYFKDREEFRHSVGGVIDVEARGSNSIVVNWPMDFNNIPNVRTVVVYIEARGSYLEVQGQQSFEVYSTQLVFNSDRYE